MTVVTHPLLQCALTRLRDARTGLTEFRRVLTEATLLLAYEATRSLATRPVKVRTPLAAARGVAVRSEVLLIPVLRAGLGMLPAMQQLLPDARVGFLGLRRNEKTFAAAAYFENLLENLRPFEVIVLDPMLSTGGSAVMALDRLVARGARRVRLLHLIAAPEGIRHVRARHPGVPIFVAAIDRKLDARARILPGLGDAGDRLCGSA